MEENKVERPLMSEEDFKDYLQKNMYNPDGSLKLYLQNWSAVSRFKSVRRAIKRGKVSMIGEIYPKRPFGNSKSATNTLKKKIYGQLKQQRGV